MFAMQIVCSLVPFEATMEQLYEDRDRLDVRGEVIVLCRIRDVRSGASHSEGTPWTVSHLCA